MAVLRSSCALLCLYGVLVCSAGAVAPQSERKYGSIYEAMTNAPELAANNNIYQRLNKLGVFTESSTATIKNGATVATIFTPVRTPSNGPGLETVRELFAPGVKTDAELMSAIESKKDELTPLLRNISAYTVVPKAVATLTDGMRLQTQLSGKFLTIYKPAKGNDTFVIGVGGFGRVIGSPIQAGSSYIYTVDWPLLPYTYYTILTKIGAIKEEGASTAGMAPPSKGLETKSAPTGGGAGPRRIMLSVDLLPGQCWAFDQVGSETQRNALAQCQNACPKGTCEQRVQQKASTMQRLRQRFSGSDNGVKYCKSYSYSHPNWYSCVANQ